MAKQTFTTGQVLTAAQMTNLQQTAMLGGSASAKTANYTLVAADAGSAITMSNAGATTITVNTGLFAAGDIVTILNVGAGTCTITAGTATVSKPTNATLALVTSAGGVLYFTATGAATFMPFATTNGAGALTFINRTSFSNVASQVVDNVFTSTYDNYLVLLDHMSAATSADDLYMQLRYGTSTETGTHYGWCETFDFNGTEGGTGWGAASAIVISTSTGSVTNKGGGQVYISSVGSTSERPNINGAYSEGENISGFTVFGGVVAVARTYTGFLLKSSSSNITGAVSVYGYSKS